MINTEDEGDSDESEEEIPCVQIKEARLGLETAIRYFEQQPDSADVDFNDLRIFWICLVSKNFNRNVNKKSTFILLNNFGVTIIY